MRPRDELRGPLLRWEPEPETWGVSGRGSLGVYFLPPGKSGIMPSLSCPKEGQILRQSEWGEDSTGRYGLFIHHLAESAQWAESSAFYR